MLDPEDLYEFPERFVQADGTVELPEVSGNAVLLHGLVGFLDAGQVVQRLTAYLPEQLEHEVIARFDVDQLLDYRSRRPQLTFDGDHYADYQAPQLELLQLADLDGKPFFLLRGREPDVGWERFVAAVHGLIDELDIGLTVEMHAFPMSVPHSRPSSFTTHGNREDLLDVVPSWRPTTVVPASVGSLLELRLSEADHDTFGLGVHVPHYLSEGDYPAAAAALLDTLSKATGLRLPSEEMHELAAEARQQIDNSLDETGEVAEIVRGLEQQYDAWLANQNDSTLAEEVASGMPTADELGATFEKFLADQAKRKGDGGLTDS